MVRIPAICVKLRANRALLNRKVKKDHPKKFKAFNVEEITAMNAVKEVLVPPRLIIKFNEAHERRYERVRQISCIRGLAEARKRDNTTYLILVANIR